MLAGSVDLLPQTVFKTNDHGRITYVNQAGCDILGYSREELEQMRLFDLVLPEERLVAMDRFRNKIARKSREASGYTLKCKNGALFPAIIHSAPVRLPDGTSGMIGIMADVTVQKETERRLLESEERFHALFETVKDVAFIKDRDLRYTDANPATAKLLGIPREKIIGSTDGEIFDPLTAGSMQEDDRAVLNGETSETERSIFINRRDTIFEIIKTPLRDREGDITGICGVARDVTDAVLYRTEEPCRAIIERMNDAVAIISGNRHIFVNQRFLDMFGFKDADELVNGMPYSYVHPDDRAVIMMRSWKRQQEGNGPEQYEFRGVARDGRIIDIEATETGMVLQGQDVALIFLRDITRQKLAARRVDAERRRLLDIIEFLPEATFAVDNSKRVIAWNREMEKITGVPKEDILGKTSYAKAFYGFERPMLVDLIQDENTDVKDLYDSLNRMGSGVYAENSLQRSEDREPKHLWLAASPVFDSNGDKAGVIETIRDLTGRKCPEHKFIQQKMEAAGNLAAGIAHNFNNLLSVIMGYSVLLKTKVNSDPELLMSYADQVITASEKASHLTAILLAYGRKQTMHMRPVGLKNLIEEIKNLLSRLLAEDTEFKVNLPEKDIIVLADRVQIEQVFMNLISNARDAMSSKGKVTIDLKTITMDETFIRKNGFGKAGPYAVITCADTGCGMDKIILDHIYDPFYTTKGAGKGNGLGVPVALGIIEQHAGYIRIDSEPDMGTTFFIYIPVIQRPEKPQDEDKERIEPAHGTETVLLAEDDAVLRALMKDIF